ncbi:hypothetical protein [Herbidospora cretacea]|uniref:hypothetical protein n=1 Tax=Herbidospora cretacea TaxID=28444 RepID=UPI0012FAB11F|nr:hypothetical protein [Herbidospora cretacea]
MPGLSGPDHGPEACIAAGGANLNANARNILGNFYYTLFSRPHGMNAITEIAAVIEFSENRAHPECTGYR